MREHFDLGDAAKFLGVSFDEALELVQSGKLPGTRSPHLGWTIPADAVLAYLKERRGNR